MPDTKLYANSYIDPSDNQRRYFLDLEATHKDDATDPNTILGGIKSTADNAETIAMGATRAMVFDTIADMETWLKTAANKGKLKIGDNLYIKAVDVPDYWVSAVYETATPEGFYYNYSRLEVGTIKLSNVVTTADETSTAIEYLFGLLGNSSRKISIPNVSIPIVTNAFGLKLLGDIRTSNVWFRICRVVSYTFTAAGSNYMFRLYLCHNYAYQPTAIIIFDVSPIGIVIVQKDANYNNFFKSVRVSRDGDNFYFDVRVQGNFNGVGAMVFGNAVLADLENDDNFETVLQLDLV
ncbi:MAG: hypothetical protein KBS70_03535 [Bacteroidales bacterium]|nr:hypothetical protein [Candidatus Colicola equi]